MPAQFFIPSPLIFHYSFLTKPRVGRRCKVNHLSSYKRGWAFYNLRLNGIQVIKPRLIFGQNLYTRNILKRHVTTRFITLPFYSLSFPFSPVVSKDVAKGFVRSASTTSGWHPACPKMKFPRSTTDGSAKVKRWTMTRPWSRWKSRRCRWVASFIRKNPLPARDSNQIWPVLWSIIHDLTRLTRSFSRVIWTSSKPGPNVLSLTIDKFHRLILSLIKCWLNSSNFNKFWDSSSSFARRSSFWFF